MVVFGLAVLYILLASPWKRPELGILTDRQVWVLLPGAVPGWRQEGWPAGPQQGLHWAAFSRPKGAGGLAGTSGSSGVLGGEGISLLWFF